MALVALGGLIVFALVLFTYFKPNINSYMRDRIVSKFLQTHPKYTLAIGAMRYRVADNRFEFDSVVISRSEPAFACRIGSLIVDRLDRRSLFNGRVFSMDALDNAEIDARDVLIQLPRISYVMACARFRVSVPDSDIVAEDFVMQPEMADESFFAARDHRRARYQLSAKQVSTQGSTCIGVMRGRIFNARTVQIDSPLLDILVNKDKPRVRDTTYDHTPVALLTWLDHDVRVDTVRVDQGTLRYCERFGIGRQAAVLTFDNLKLHALGIDNRPDSTDSAIVHAEASFMGGGTLRIDLAAPLRGTDLSLTCSGSLSGMDIKRLNPFVTVAEQTQIESGRLESASFQFNVRAGHATGTVRAAYQDLEFSSMENLNLMESIARFVIDRFKIRKTNMPDRAGAMKVGHVNYNRRPNDNFFRFLWFSVRSGLWDIIGL